MFLNAKKPVIRKVIVQKKAASSSTPPPPLATSSSSSSSSSSLRKVNQAPTSSRQSQVAKTQNDARSRSRPTSQSLPTQKKHLHVQREESRKRKTTPSQVLSSDSESSEDDGGGCGDDDDGQIGSKRARVTAHERRPYDTNRRIWRLDRDVAVEDDEASSGLLTGASLVEGNPGDFQPAFTGDSDITQLSLHYPGRVQPERFKLAIPRESDGYKPLEDIIQSVERMWQYYILQERPSDDDSDGFPRRLKRAVTRQSLADFISTINEFNSLVEKSANSNIISRNLESIHHVPLPLIERILSQIYARTVSPRVESLRKYENGSDNVYGELLPRFASQIFKDARLTSDQIFVDLGSGVGNVVLQAALEVGCDSWGCEIMPNPCDLAAGQADEFRARCKLWGIAPGNVHLVQGNFLSDEEVAKVLTRADVILVNNQAFTPGLNDDLVLKFLDLKEGARLVSLNSFVPSGFRMQARNVHDPRNLLDVTRKEYGSCSVSWTDSGGEYFVAVKDSKKLERFQRSLK